MKVRLLKILILKDKGILKPTRDGEFTYVGSIITIGGRSKNDTKREMVQDKKAFYQKKMLFLSNILGVKKIS